MAWLPDESTTTRKCKRKKKKKKKKKKGSADEERLAAGEGWDHTGEDGEEEGNDADVCNIDDILVVEGDSGVSPPDG